MTLFARARTLIDSRCLYSKTTGTTN
jgi:hypothetical protein